jgi:hypothetical protein
MRVSAEMTAGALMLYEAAGKKSKNLEIHEIPRNAGLRLDKKRNFHYSRNMAKALNKRSMQGYADRERCTDARSAGAGFQTTLEAAAK